MGVEVCVYCGRMYVEGYCWESPSGAHVMEYDADAVDPYSCCDECGTELHQGELDGVIEHVCDPTRVQAFKAWQERAAVDDDCPPWEWRR